ncbi:hypothetical protein EZS27_010661 [termite gut metagenome]|uniref:Uncharacterized protein n=1 Tax=termite gut metagenome TaxID=433724 RepID=A0A5J4S668_9ZZZZ
MTLLQRVHRIDRSNNQSNVISQALLFNLVRKGHTYFFEFIEVGVLLR